MDKSIDLKRLANTKTMHLHPLTNELVEHKQMMKEYKNTKHFPQVKPNSVDNIGDLDYTEKGLNQPKLSSEYIIEN